MLNETATQNIENVEATLETESDASAETTSPAPEISLILNYLSSGTPDEGDFRIVKNETLALLLDGGEETEDVKRIKENLSSTPHVIPFHFETAKQLHESWNEIMMLYADVMMKHRELAETNTMLKNKLENLEKENRITVNKSVLDNNEASIADYTKLLTELAEEIKKEVQVFGAFATSKNMYYCAPAEFSITNPLIMLEAKIKNTKRYVKNVRRDINISYSRYCFSLNTQLKQISYLELTTQRR